MIVEALGFELDPADWMPDAACRGTDIRPFFPPLGHSAAEARALCATCPVQAECLDYALRWRIDCGIWGGLNEHERRRLLRDAGVDTRRPTRPVRRLPAPHGTTTRCKRGCRCDGCTDANSLATLLAREAP